MIKEVETLLEMLATKTPEERVEFWRNIFDVFCECCGDEHPPYGRKCQCWNDE
ncbi:hypothetical protein LCGC14_1101870 [marine sediment metagenome]|uniref:Uncharacterized protein n=1 Tax=marine sediment metagenome TaxID=412755 RepID=A0A0F9MDS0_9ZZZZ